ncbi:beta-N-acetylglucosaminidase domain-containing protein [Leekyejoonella antrihumi]|uniref:Beta-N-acetylhexosaminidase n=1 Tax=Leekyejoonella antrihumi TaxID=1660198 RepID=A0A563DWM6_9MICO|nr:beta-N-acetylglucosaminidase domain-containing protein [Leekyejoonella antrihumi]TWP34104.1 beta-N-acetylhexosaminidase [Leekyejoonella antrihumi]
MFRKACATAAVTVLTAALGTSLTAMPAQATTARHGNHVALPAVYPAPQSMRATGTAVALGDRVAVVAGPGSDHDALVALRSLLSTSGIHHIDQSKTTADLPGGEPVIFLGGPEVTHGSAAALRALHVTDASSLPAEGYVLADGRVNGRPVVILDGHDGTGTFYAVQTLRQLIEHHGGQVPGVLVRDWPATSLRGVIEGFYGQPWSNAQRAAQLQFYGQNKMNTYIYSPKDDPYLRAQWRDPYPADQLAAIKTLVDTAAANHVQFTYALSPGLSICYSSASDEQALVAKLQSLWNIGVRSFSIPFDDISYTHPNCAADTATFGTGPTAAGAEQSSVLNYVQKDFIDTHPGAQPLQTVPTEYYDVTPSAYKATIKKDLNPNILVGWTGVGVAPATITAAQTEQAETVYGHKILIWDNFPVTDYDNHSRLLLGPYIGRQAGIAENAAGVTVNPMPQAEASKITEFTVAAFLWNPHNYQPQQTWQAGLTALAGPDLHAQTALAAFADLNRSSRMDPTQAPELTRLMKAFWSSWNTGNSGGSRQLDTYLNTIQHASATLSQSMDDPHFVAEATPWLDSASEWAEAARDATAMLRATRSRDGAAALNDRAYAMSAMAKAKAHTYTTAVNGTIPVDLGAASVFTDFINAAMAQLEHWLGLPATETAMSSMGTYQTDKPANMIDGNPATYYWSNQPVAPGDYVGVDLGTTVAIDTITITGGDPTSPNDYIHNATLEYSTDGTTWTTVDSYTDTADITATLPAGTKARYVRLVATQGDKQWVKIHAFTVTDAQTTTVTGTPAAAPGSSLAGAADENLDTSYTAATRPATGDAVVATLADPRVLHRVTIIGTGQARVQISTTGQWVTIGRLAHSGFTDLAADDRNTDAIRLLWDAGSATPTITEIIPRSK